MQFVVVVRGTWPVAARAVGLRYPAIAAATGVSLDTVRSYATGRRVAPAAWLEQVSSLIAARGSVSRVD